MKKEDVLLIVEDNSYELENYLVFCKKAGFKSYGVSSLEAAKAVLESKRVDVLITDLHLSPQASEGLQVIEEALHIQNQIIPIVMSSHPDHRLYHEAIHKGALFALKKPLINEDEIIIAVRSAREKRIFNGIKPKDLELSPHLEVLCEDGICLDRSIRKWVEVAAQSKELPVVIYGETGTGKEEVAKLIAKHRKKREGDIPFVSVNCSLLDGDLAQSLLFGHKKGAFSGACSTTQGFIGEAHGGILFLDEIHTLPLSCQQKILRVMNDGSYYRVGDSKVLYSEFQTVVASTQDLDDAVERGVFLLDLRARLTGCDIHLAPLRERMSDLPLLVELYFVKNSVAVSTEDLSKIIARCREFYWQGNIRQLYQCLRALVAISHANGMAPNLDFLPILKTMYAPRLN